MIRPAAACALLAMPVPVLADPFEDFGTAMKYALPAAAALCAARDDRIEDFSLRGAVQIGVVLALKHLFQDAPIGRRPHGGGEGFPSGHTAFAFFGAADLAGKCFADDAAAGSAVYGAAAATGFSRLQAGEHTIPQVMTGALIGFSLGAASFGIGGETVSVSIGMRF